MTNGHYEVYYECTECDDKDSFAHDSKPEIGSIGYYNGCGENSNHDIKIVKVDTHYEYEDDL